MKIQDDAKVFVHKIQKHPHKKQNVAYDIDKKVKLIYYYKYPARGFRARCMDFRDVGTNNRTGLVHPRFY